MPPHRAGHDVRGALVRGKGPNGTCHLARCRIRFSPLPFAGSGYIGRPAGVCPVVCAPPAGGNVVRATAGPPPRRRQEISSAAPWGWGRRWAARGARTHLRARPRTAASRTPPPRKRNFPRKTSARRTSGRARKLQRAPESAIVARWRSLAAAAGGTTTHPALSAAQPPPWALDPAPTRRRATSDSSGDEQQGTLRGH